MHVDETPQSYSIKVKAGYKQIEVSIAEKTFLWQGSVDTLCYKQRVLKDRYRLRTGNLNHP